MCFIAALCFFIEKFISSFKSDITLHFPILTNTLEFRNDFILNIQVLFIFTVLNNYDHHK